VCELYKAQSNYANLLLCNNAQIFVKYLVKEANTTIGFDFKLLIYQIGSFFSENLIKLEASTFDFKID
jgi:hypothetical protein